MLKQRILTSAMLALVFIGLFCSSLLLGGCRSGSQSNPALLSLMPTVEVTALEGKITGDSGKKLVRQEAEDQPTISANSGPEITSAALTHGTPVQQLTPIGVGPGLVVCEPVAMQADTGTAAFGDGCGRWLHFTVAGLPQMGQTPLWSSLERAESEMGRADLRLALPDAKRLASILGVTHVATGQITGNSTHCLLSYQLYTVPGGAAVGPALQASGTQAQALSQLPALAHRLAASLGISTALLLAAIPAAPADIALLGRLARYPDDILPPAQIHQLQTLATRLPLAGFFLVNTSDNLSDAQWNAAVKTLLAQEPDNGLVWAQMGYSDPSLLALSQPQLSRNGQAFPQNYLFAAANTWVQRRRQNAAAERLAAEKTVQNAWHNPDAWLTLGSTISEQASRLRQSRLASNITAQEWQVLNSSYSQWLYAVFQAAQLDPLFGKAWDRTAQAATFAGYPRQADQALWKDIALNKNDPGTYSWGLQMYQSKWDGNSQKLHKIAQALATISYPTISQGLLAAKVLRDNEDMPDQFLAERSALLAQILARTHQAIAGNPGNAQAHYDQAYALSLAGHKQKAIIEYKNVAFLRPADPQSYFDLAQEYDQRGIAAPAIAAYRQGLRLDPANATAHYSLGWDLKNQKQLPQAEAEMRQAIKIAPFYPEAHAGLATVLEGEHRGKESVAEMQQAVKLNPFLIPAVGELGELLDEQGKYAESLTAGRHALQINPQDKDSMDYMADDYLHLKLWDRSIQMSQTALQVDASDTLAHENLGEAYIGQGRKAEAQEEWNKVLTMDQGDLAHTARQMLAKYP